MSTRVLRLDAKPLVRLFLRHQFAIVLEDDRRRVTRLQSDLRGTLNHGDRLEPPLSPASPLPPVGLSPEVSGQELSCFCHAYPRLKCQPRLPEQREKPIESGFQADLMPCPLCCFLKPVGLRDEASRGLVGRCCVAAVIHGGFVAAAARWWSGAGERGSGPVVPPMPRVRESQFDVGSWPSGGGSCQGNGWLAAMEHSRPGGGKQAGCLFPLRIARRSVAAAALGRTEGTQRVTRPLACQSWR